MTKPEAQGKHAPIDVIVDGIEACDTGATRVLVGIAGPPAAGKSTFASMLAARLGPHAAVLPMDGYHFDNAKLREMGLLDRKGAPQTFDSPAFVKLVGALRQHDEIAYPTFDRDLDKTIPNGACIDGKTRIVLIEGNYLLLKRPPWSELGALFDLTVYLDVPRNILKSRLLRRWLEQGLPEAQAEARAELNDMKNVDLVNSSSKAADFTYWPDR